MLYGIDARMNTKPQSKLGRIVRVTSGNFLEMFDFFLYGFYATAIAQAFFPLDDKFASLMAVFVTFGAGFLMRPLGAIVLGGYIDRVGRRKGLIVTLALMACGTVLIACVPGYAMIGPLAPILVLIGRLLQGFSAGAELGGVSVYLAEIAKPGRKGFYAAWQSASQQVAIMAAAGIGYALHAGLAPQTIDAWGWRIPFLLGCLIVPFVFLIRRTLAETEDYLARDEHPDTAAIFRSIRANLATVVAGMLLVAMTTVSFYLIAVYTPTYGQTVLQLSALDSLAVTFCIGLSNFCWLPVMGAVSDRLGREPLLLFFTSLTLLTAYPALAWLVAGPNFEKMLAVELWLSFLYAGYNGAMIVALTEIMPANVRTVGFSLAYSLATAIFGGFTQAIANALIKFTGNDASPAFWMSFAALCSLTATLFLYRGRSRTTTASVPAVPVQTMPEVRDRG
jgi:MHS family citrate/tricarballylate:H+ symporter-like MFS transporter